MISSRSMALSKRFFSVKKVGVIGTG